MRNVFSRKRNVFLFALCFSLLFGMTVYAAEWKNDGIGWWWQEDDGSYPAGCWRWIDGNGDSVAECYYFDNNGYMLADTTTPDGYTVNGSGAWVVQGVVQTQQVNGIQSENSDSSGGVNASSGAVYEAYQTALSQYKVSETHSYRILGRSKSYKVYSKYALYDIDKNGIPELIVNPLDGNDFDIYTFDGQSAVRCGHLFSAYKTLYGCDGNGIIEYTGGTGRMHMESADTYALNGNSLSKTNSLSMENGSTMAEVQGYVNSHTAIGGYVNIDDLSVLSGLK